MWIFFGVGGVHLGVLRDLPVVLHSGIIPDGTEVTVCLVVGILAQEKYPTLPVVLLVVDFFPAFVIGVGGRYRMFILCSGVNCG